MSYESVVLQTKSNGPDLNNFKGIIWFGLSRPFEEPQVSRRFGFEVKNYRRQGGVVVIKDGEEPILEVEDELVDAPWEHNFSTERWSKFSPTQRAMIRLLMIGVFQGVAMHWHLVSDVTTHVLQGITKEDVRTIRFAPLVSN